MGKEAKNGNEWLTDRSPNRQTLVLGSSQEAQNYLENTKETSHKTEHRRR